MDYDRSGGNVLAQGKSKNRQVITMRRLMYRMGIASLLLVVVAGCHRAEKQSLKGFLESMAVSLGRPYDDQLKGLSGPERNIRFRVLFARDQLAAVETYLDSKPPIGEEAHQKVAGYQSVMAAELSLYERLLAEKRYNLNDAEKEQDADLQIQAQQYLEMIGHLIDK